MPIIKSAKKALRGSKRKHIVNLRVKRAYKEAVRDVRKTATPLRSKGASAGQATETLKGKKKDEALKKALTKAYSELDKAAKKGVIHKNKASRLKSRLAKLAQS